MSEEHPTPIHEPESPKAFFRILRERGWYQHQLLAKRVCEAGFEVRRIVRERHHPVWQIYLRRGSVMPGQELVTVKGTISGVLRNLGVKCPPKEVDALVKGDRVEAAFIYAPGTPGTLSYYGGSEQWLAEPEEDSAGQDG